MKLILYLFSPQRRKGRKDNAKVFLCATFAFSASLRFKKCKESNSYSVKSFFNMRNNKEMHERNIVNIEIINRGNRFSLLGETGSSYIDPSVRRHWDDLKVKLDEGAPLRLLIVNPFCKSKRLRNELNGVTTKLDPKLKLEIIYNLYRKYPNVDVKFTDEIYCSIFFSEREMMYDPYHLGKVADRLENYFLAFHFEDRNASPGSFSYYKILKNHFEILWTKAIDLETFIDMYRSHLQEAGLESIVTLSQT